MTTTKDMKTLSFDGGSTIYQLIDDTALHPEDVSSEYTASSDAPVNSRAVEEALSTLVIPETTDNVTSGSSSALTSGGAYTNLVRRLSTSQATGGVNQGVYVDSNGQIQACNATTSTYSSTGTIAVNGTAVASAIANLVPNTRTINNKALTADVSLDASDVGALSDTTTINDLTTSAQQSALNSGVTSSVVSQVSTNTGSISTIQGLIPSEASTTNQLADKEFVNSSITTNTANFIGTFPSVSALEQYSGTVTKNDYAFVETTDSSGNNFYDRYKYTGTAWLFEYEINNGTFTAVQWESINSGVTASDVALAQSALQPNTPITGGTHSKITYDSNGLVTGGSDLNSSDITTALGFTPYNSTNPAGYITNSDIANLVPNTRTINGKTLNADISLDASDVGALPDNTIIPTITDTYNSSSSDGMSGIAVASAIGNGTITFTQGGVTKGTITTNQSGNTTIALDASSGGTWGSITGTLSNQTDLHNALTSIIVFRNWEAQS